MPIPGRVYSSGSYRYGFNGKENDNEVKGNGNQQDYSMRIYDPRLGRFLSLDPLAKKYPQYSPYMSFNNNPICYIDPDGRDYVYFNNKGIEILRILNDKVFETYVQSNLAEKPVDVFPSFKDFKTETWKSTKKAFNILLDVQRFQKVDMPDIITTRTQSNESVSAPQFQKNDYQIAASTFLTNKELNSGSMVIADKGGAAIPQEELLKVPDISVDMVKAWSMQESHSGVTGSILQVNNNSDFTADKQTLGITKGATFTVHQEINLAIRYLMGKGFTTDKITYSDGGKTVNKTYTWGGWIEALKNYNGGGVKGYEGFIQSMMDNAQAPKPANYVELPKK